MICKNCGGMNPDDALFCSNCGTRIDAAAPAYGTETPVTPVPPVTPVTPVAPVDPAATPYAQPGTTYGGYNYSTNPVPKPGNGKRNWAAVAGLVCSILSLPCCFVPYCGILLAITALVFGILGLKSQHKGMSIAAIIIASIGILINAFMLVAVIHVMTSAEFSQVMDDMMNTMQL